MGVEWKQGLCLVLRFARFKQTSLEIDNFGNQKLINRVITGWLEVMIQKTLNIQSRAMEMLVLLMAEHFFTQYSLHNPNTQYVAGRGWERLGVDDCVETI
jgi:hypothetical protein